MKTKTRVKRKILKGITPKTKKTIKGIKVNKKDKTLWHSFETDFKNLDGDEFEKIIANLYRKKGYHVRKTPIGADNGVDLIVRKGKSKTIVQAKNWSGKVGSQPIRDLAGTRELEHANHAIIITSSTFTKSASDTLRRFRRVHGITINGLKKEFRKHYSIKPPKKETIFDKFGKIFPGKIKKKSPVRKTNQKRIRRRNPIKKHSRRIRQ